MTTIWNAGKNALAVCDRCGFTVPYQERKREAHGAWVCDECFDGIYQKSTHPQLKIKAPPPDGLLQNPRPDAVILVPVQLSVGNRVR